jgi:hypothetical protein
MSSAERAGSVGGGVEVGGVGVCGMREVGSVEEELRVLVNKGEVEGNGGHLAHGLVPGVKTPAAWVGRL